MIATVPRPLAALPPEREQLSFLPGAAPVAQLACSQVEDGDYIAWLDPSGRTTVAYVHLAPIDERR